MKKDHAAVRAKVLETAKDPDAYIYLSKSDQKTILDFEILPAFSGKSGSYAAAPNGKYIISHFPWLKDDYYALVHVDGMIDDFVDGTPSNYDPSQTMGHIRLHPGLVSHACVTLPVDTSQWNSVESLLTNAQQGNPLNIGGESFPTYGELTVQGSGHGSVP